MRKIWIIVAAAFRADWKNTTIALVLWTFSTIAPLAFAVGIGALANATAETYLAIALLLAIAAASSMVISEIAWKIIQNAQERTSHQLDRDLVNAIAGVTGIEHFERPEYIDTLSHLRNDHWFLGQALPVFFTSIFIGVQFILTLLILVKISPWLMLIFLFAIPEGIANTRAERRRIEGMKQLRQQWRRSDDMFDLITKAESAKEVRVFGLADEILARHRDSSQKSWEREFGDRLAGAWLLSVTRVLLLTAFSASILLLAERVITGDLPIGMILTFVALTGTLLSQVSFATTQITFLTYAFTAVDRYVWVCDYAKTHMKSGTSSAPDFPTNGITFDHVSFTYPGTTREVLRDISFTMPIGKTVAIIGDNGAGKSTVIKLLTRMYEPTAGSIRIDDTPLGDLDTTSWRSRISAAFQDHARFEVVAQESVGVGDLNEIENVDHVNAAINAGGARDVIDELPDGLDTQLGARWDNGVDLSGGQWQKLAVARAMMREPALLLLDEPTAALDAETENLLFERFADATRRNSQGITVLVSHRFSTVRMADLIIVISDGIVKEQGSHHALLAKDGLYAELYNLQARAYQ